MILSNKNIITIILLLLCIFISIAFSQVPFMLEIFRNSNIKEGLGNNKYLDGVSEQLSNIEDTIQGNSDAKDKSLNDEEKLQKIKEFISKMPDDDGKDNHKYKSELKKVLDTKDNAIFKIIMEKIKDMRKKITNDAINDSKSQAKDSSKNPALKEV